MKKGVAGSFFIQQLLQRETCNASFHAPNY